MSKLPKQPVFNRHVWAQQEERRRIRREYINSFVEQDTRRKLQRDRESDIITGVIMAAVAVIIISSYL